MKTLFRLIIFNLIIATNTSAQDAKSYYDQAMEKAYAGKLEDAIKLFDKSLELDQTHYVVWYNRALAKGMLNDFEAALPDLEQTIRLYPNFKQGFLNRGTAKKHLTDYEGAIDDYNIALKFDPEYADAYFNRGLVYEMLGKKDSACLDFNTAKKYGYKNSDRKIEKCRDNSAPSKNYFSILRLTKTAANDKYGFTPEDPVKVGYGPDGGPANQRAYLDLLRDNQGKPLKYIRLGSCCMYDSPNAIMGKGMLDKYEITYRSEKNKEVKSILYLSFDDYEELKIPYGFKTVGQAGPGL